MLSYGKETQSCHLLHFVSYDRKSEECKGEELVCVYACERETSAGEEHKELTGSEAGQNANAR